MHDRSILNKLSLNNSVLNNHPLIIKTDMEIILNMNCIKNLDLLVIISAFFFGVHILLIDKFVHYTDGIRLSCIQFAVCGVCCTVGALIFEEIDIQAILNAAVPIFYAGVISGAIGYTLQIIAQKWVEPNIAPLIMCLESVVALFAGMILKDEHLHAQVYIGCGLVFLAIILAQIEFKKPIKSKREVKNGLN